MFYFAYGSNLSKEQMLNRCPNSVPVRRAVLSGYRLEFAGKSSTWDGGGVATIVPDEADKVLGAIYEVSDLEMKILDGYEAGYSRMQVVTSVGPAITYLGKVGGCNAPSKRYADRITSGYKDWGIERRLGVKMGDNLIFVYGTLKRGLWNYERLLKPLEPACTAVIQGYELRYASPNRVPDEARRIYDPRFGIPVAVSKEGGTVAGEVYEVDTITLRRIDGLEGVEPETGKGRVYSRKETEALIKGGALLRVIAYVGEASRNWYNLTGE